MLVNIITCFPSVRTGERHPIFICEWYLPISLLQHDIMWRKRSEPTPALVRDPANVGNVTEGTMKNSMHDFSHGFTLDHLVTLENIMCNLQS